MEQTLLITCVFGAVALVGFFVSKMMVGDPESSKLRNRLSDRKATESQVAITRGADKNAGVLPMLQRVGQAAAEPFMPKTRESQGAIRQKMGRAGIYNASAAKVMKGAQVILMAAGTLTGLYFDFSAGKFMGATAAGGLLGYLIPTLVLRHMIKKNQLALTYGLADALDLMVVCVEAGLTVDAAMQRVGSEMSIAHPAISREFSITHMETRVGLPRMDALKNMGSRTGCEALQSLASMLIQADRFGTSIAQALRVHADTLRTNRQHAAEEMAAKASVKMTFPLVLFIFPATFIVLAGPTVIGLMNSALFK